MKVTYTGKTRDFTAKLETKIQEKLTAWQDDRTAG